MSDFTSDFWSFYVAVLTIVSVVACGVLLYVMGRMRVAKGNSPDTTGHVWDEDLAEYNNPLPRWWMWLFYITIAFGFLYLALYPGLGKVPGLLGGTMPLSPSRTDDAGESTDTWTYATFQRDQSQTADSHSRVHPKFTPGYEAPLGA